MSYSSNISNQAIMESIKEKEEMKKMKMLRNYRPSTAPELFAALYSAATHVLCYHTMPTL